MTETLTLQQKFAHGRTILKDALVERDDEVDLVATALIAQEHSILVGEPGCLHPNTPIHDPVDGSTKTVYERFLDGREFHVHSMNEGTKELVVTKAEKPWEYPTSEMFEVRMSSGKTFTVTGGHKVWTGSTYLCVSEVSELLRVCGPFPLPSISDNDLSNQKPNVPHSTQTTANSPDGCHLSLHSYDAQLLQPLNNDLGFSPSLNDALEHIHPASHVDVQDMKRTNNLCASFCPHSKQDYSPRSALPTETKCESQPSLNFSEQSPSLLSWLLPSCSYNEIVGKPQSFSGGFLLPTSTVFSSSLCEAKSILLETTANCVSQPTEQICNALLSPCWKDQTQPIEEAQNHLAEDVQPYQTPITWTGQLQEDHVIEIRKVESSRYYDFHVPKYENYLACGVIHHNTAKSLLLDNLLKFLSGANKFSILLTKFTTPEEVFGPISVKGLKEDVYRRLTTNMFPEAHISLVDEVFKASSAILNTLLRLLNERVFSNGDGTFRKCPLMTCVAASNEWPNSQDGGQELGALFDRFLFRKKVKGVSAKSGRKELLRRAVENDACQAAFKHTVTPEEVKLAHQQASNLPWTAEAKQALWQILEELNREGIRPGDRRQYKAIGAARAYAWLEQQDRVLPTHLEILSHVLWEDPTEQPDETAKIIGRIANPTTYKVNDLLTQCEDVLANLEKAAPDGKKKSAVEATPKLQAIRDEIKKLGLADPKVKKAHAYVVAQLKLVYDRVIGLSEGDE